MNTRDIRYLKRIRSGDIKVFEELFHQYYPGMCSYAESLVKRGELAEEIVQDVFFNIWKNKEELNITSGWRGYLFRSVFNHSMMYLRKKNREVPLDQEWAGSLKEPDDQPEETIDAQDLDAALVFALQDLPERTREIFNLSRFEGLKYREIAEKLSISVKTVESNMGKALRALRISLDEYRNRN